MIRVICPDCGKAMKKGKKYVDQYICKDGCGSWVIKTKVEFVRIN